MQICQRHGDMMRAAVEARGMTPLVSQGGRSAFDKPSVSIQAEGGSMKRWDAAADEARFRQDVETGDRWVRRIAQRLEGYGLWRIDVPAVQVRGSFDARREFRDDGDMFLNGHRIEVRSFGFRFTGAADFPQKTVQVELASVAGAKANAAAYLFISRQTGAVVGLFGPELRKLDRQDGVWNQRRGVARDWMVAQANRLKDFDSVVTYLAERCAVQVQVGD